PCNSPRKAASRCRHCGILTRRIRVPVPHSGPLPCHAERPGHGTLAALLGVQRPSLNKVLMDLERDGLIRISHSSIEVLDPARLSTVSCPLAGSPPVLLPALGLPVPCSRIQPRARVLSRAGLAWSSSSKSGLRPGAAASRCPGRSCNQRRR